MNTQTLKSMTEQFTGNYQLVSQTRIYSQCICRPRLKIVAKTRFLLPLSLRGDPYRTMDSAWRGCQNFSSISNVSSLCWPLTTQSWQQKGLWYAFETRMGSCVDPTGTWMRSGKKKKKLQFGMFTVGKKSVWEAWGWNRGKGQQGFLAYEKCNSEIGILWVSAYSWSFARHWGLGVHGK